MKLQDILRIIRLNIAGITAILSMSFNTEAHSQAWIPDRPGVPFFEIISDNASESLPLLSTSAEVSIAGVIAHVTVKQVYRNRGSKPLEAVYVFPGSTRAAVHGLNMKIGERTIVAKIEERDKARNEYTRAISEGRTASLLEQQRPNVFQMNVGNIMPGDLVEVELSYTENIIPKEGVYEFVYPTVAGPRYPGSSETGNRQPDWNDNPYLQEGLLPSYTFSLECSISTGIPLRNPSSPSHKIDVIYKDKMSATINLRGSELQGGNRDFILQYSLGGSGIESGLLLYSDGRENYFMATIQPPDQVKPEMIPPREYIFIVDVSGSMYGFPLTVSKSLINNLLSELKSTDCFNILFFAGGNKLFADRSVPATTDNIEKAMKMLDSQSGSGGTELLPALKKALSMSLRDDFARTFVIATDGYVTVEKEAFELVKSNLNRASFFAFGIGSSVNRYLIEGLAHAGAGEPCIITGKDNAKEKADEFRKYINAPVLTDVSILFDEFDAYEVEPSSVPDVFASRPVVIYGKYRGGATGNIKLSGQNGSGKFNTTIPVTGVHPSVENQAIKYLWAREQIRIVEDYAGGYGGVPDNIKAQVTQLGLKYNLLTAYTSFVAIDSEVRNNCGQFTTVRQPIPLPEGVSNYATGAIVSGVSHSKTGRAEMRQEYIVSEENEFEIVEDEIFAIVESMPEFSGGNKALKEFIRLNLQYPEEALKNHVSGKVILQFTVNTNGSISDVKVLRSVGFGCDEEAIRLIESMPAWIPGKQRGIPVKCVLTLPVQF